MQGIPSGNLFGVIFVLCMPIALRLPVELTFLSPYSGRRPSCGEECQPTAEHAPIPDLQWGFYHGRSIVGILP